MGWDTPEGVAAEVKKQQEQMRNRDISFYLDRAKRIQRYSSDLQLARALGYKNSAVSYLRNGKQQISDEKMIILSKLAAIDPAMGLLDLNTWRSTGAAKEAYKKILKKMGGAALFGALVLVYVLLPEKDHDHIVNALMLLPAYRANPRLYIITSAAQTGVDSKMKCDIA